jgi:dihydroorotate dehydrogenase electron transfer subunit
MNKRAELVTVLSNNKLNHDTHLLKFQSGHKLDEVLPGQFVNIFVPDSPETFLRRPFSFCETDIAKGTFSVLVKVVGSGTKRIAETGPGSWLNILYPLGNGFSLPQKNNSVLLVGGGVALPQWYNWQRSQRK